MSAEKKYYNNLIHLAFFSDILNQKCIRSLIDPNSARLRLDRSFGQNCGEKRKFWKKMCFSFLKPWSNEVASRRRLETWV